MNRPDHPIVVRANGGYMLHALPAAGMVALCGQTPVNTGRMSRGKWLYRGTVAEHGALVSCVKCKQKLGELK